MDVPVLSLSDIEFRYGNKGGDKVGGFQLCIPRFQINTGETVLLLGESGSGKSTLLNLITGVAKPDRGDIQIVGKPMQADKARQSDRLRGEHIGLIFQSLNLLPYTSVEQAVGMALAFSPARRARLAGPERQAIMDLLDKLNLDAAKLIDRRVTALSFGQQQRVAAARALIGSPELIVADEPISALDAKSQDRFLTLLFGTLDRQKQALLLVSHDERIAPLFDRVVRLEELRA